MDGKRGNKAGAGKRIGSMQTETSPPKKTPANFSKGRDKRGLRTILDKKHFWSTFQSLSSGILSHIVLH